jgi:hypothetical protein
MTRSALSSDESIHLTSDEQFWLGRLSRNGFVGMVAPRKETMHHRW